MPNSTEEFSNGFVPLPSAVVMQYAHSTSPAYLSVYITAYGLFYINGRCDVSELSVLGMPHDFVLKALMFWEEKGLVTVTCADNTYKLEFSVPGKQTDAANADSGCHLERIKDARRPVYSNEEISVFRKGNKEIEELIKLAEQSIGEPLKATQVNLVIGLYDWYGLPFDVTKVLMNHCASIGKFDGRYVEKIAQDWSEHSVLTEEQAESRLKLFSVYGKIMSMMGMSSSTGGTASQKACMDRWLGEYGFPLVIINEAIERSSMATTRLTFSYVEKKLKAWFDEGVKTLEDAERAEKNGKAPRRGKKHDFETREWNEEKVKDMMAREREYLASKLLNNEAKGE